MLKKVGAIAAIAATVAVVAAATLGGTASAKAGKAAVNPLCKTAGLGFAGPLTGGAAFLGKDQSNWVRLMIKNWNAGKKMPGVPKSLHRVKLNLALLGDSQLNPQVAATVGRQMVANKKILGMVGFAGSNEELGGGPVLDAAKLPYVTGSATKDTLATGATGQKPLKYFFRVVPINSTQAKAGVAYIVPKLKLNKGSKVMIVDDGEAYGIDIANAAQKAFKAAGITKLTRESVKETDANPGGSAGFAADMAPVALKASTGGYKLVYAPSQDAPDSQSFVEQLKTDGYKGGSWRRTEASARSSTSSRVRSSRSSAPGSRRSTRRTSSSTRRPTVRRRRPTRSGLRASSPPRCSAPRSRSSARHRTARRSAGRSWRKG
jgi:ABC-type branched-subunit amino acid transport system substrate-binding protein